jgi:GGDEF domain-containing protein
MPKHEINPPIRERRVALTKRRLVAQMSPEEMRRELLTSEVTGLPNRRAFDEAGTALAVAMSDVDGLKALNKYGYEVGNAILRAKAEALGEASLEAYHDKGDEFLCRGNDRNELAAKLERARAILRKRTIFVELSDGSTRPITGADFSYGVGQDIEEAESRLRSHKAHRESRGEIVRGELRGITIGKQNFHSQNYTLSSDHLSNLP